MVKTIKVNKIPANRAEAKMITDQIGLPQGTDVEFVLDPTLDESPSTPSAPEPPPPSDSMAVRIAKGAPPIIGMVGGTLLGAPLLGVGAGVGGVLGGLAGEGLVQAAESYMGTSDRPKTLGEAAGRLGETAVMSLPFSRGAEAAGAAGKIIQGLGQISGANVIHNATSPDQREILGTGEAALSAALNLLVHGLGSRYAAGADAAERQGMGKQMLIDQGLDEAHATALAPVLDAEFNKALSTVPGTSGEAGLRHISDKYLDPALNAARAQVGEAGFGLQSGALSGVEPNLNPGVNPDLIKRPNPNLGAQVEDALQNTLAPANKDAIVEQVTGRAPLTEAEQTAMNAEINSGVQAIKQEGEAIQGRTKDIFQELTGQTPEQALADGMDEAQVGQKAIDAIQEKIAQAEAATKAAKVEETKTETVAEVTEEAK